MPNSPRRATKVAGEIAAGPLHRQPVEETEPALAGADAVLVVAPDHDPRRGGQKRRRRREEIRIPGVPAVAEGTAGAAPVVDRACRFTVMIIADMDHEIGARGRRHRGDFGKRPCHGIIAVLGRIARRQPAPGVAEYQDALRVRPRQRQRLAVHDRGDRPRRHRDLAAPHREDGGFDILERPVRLRTHRHGRRGAVEQHGRTGIVRDRPHARRAVRAEFDPLRQHPGLRTPDRKQAQNGNGSRGVEPVAALDLHGRPFTLDF